MMTVALNLPECIKCSRVHNFYEAPNHHPMLAEVATATLVTIQAAIAAFMLSVMPADQVELMSWTLLPFVGATLAAGGAFCLNTQQEVRKIVVGRCLFAIVVGVIGPRLMSMIHPSMLTLMADPLLKVGAGFVHGFIGYVMSWPVVRKSYERAPAAAAKVVKTVEDRMVSQIGARVASDAAVVAIGVAQELHKSNPQDHSAAHVAEAIATVAQKSADQSQPPAQKS